MGRVHGSATEVDFRAERVTQARDPMWPPIFGRSKKVDNQPAAPRTGETDVSLGAAGGALHSVEPLRVVACRGTALSEPWGS